MHTTTCASSHSSFYSKADFDQTKRDKYKAAVANAAGTTSANVEILSILEARRRAGSIEVETKVSQLAVSSACRNVDSATSFPNTDWCAHLGHRSVPQTQRVLTSSSRRLGLAILS